MSAVNINRQTVLQATRDFTFDDFESGVAKAMIYLKPGTTILRGFIDITEAFDSGTSDSITVGDTEADDVDKYLTATDAQAAALTALTGPPLTDGVVPGAEAVTMTLTSVGTAATAGAGRLVIEYIEEQRVSEYHAYRG